MKIGEWVFSRKRPFKHDPHYYSFVAPLSKGSNESNELWICSGTTDRALQLPKDCAEFVLEVFDEYEEGTFSFCADIYEETGSRSDWFHCNGESFQFDDDTEYFVYTMMDAHGYELYVRAKVTAYTRPQETTECQNKS